MNKEINKLVQPSNSNINYWVKTLIPKKDVWFFKNTPKFNNVELLTIKDYLKIFDDINFNNSYCHWLTKQKAKFVIVDNSNWISNLTLKEKEFVLKNQIEIERGLILENCADFSEVDNIKNFIYENKLILNNFIFKHLNKKSKKEIAIAYAKEQDCWNCVEFKSNIKHIDKIANSFINHEGTNCLAIVLYGLTKVKKYLKTWVQENEFNMLTKNYEIISRKQVCFGDIAVFFDENNNVVHACYALNNNLFLNKSGQSKFNPVLILNFNEIKKDWQNLNVVFKRKL